MINILYFYLIGSVVAIILMLFQRYQEYKYCKITFSIPLLLKWSICAAMYSWVCVPTFIDIILLYKEGTK